MSLILSTDENWGISMRKFDPVRQIEAKTLEKEQLTESIEVRVQQVLHLCYNRKLSWTTDFLMCGFPKHISRTYLSTDLHDPPSDFFSTKFRSLALTKALTKELSELEAVFFWGLEEFVLGPKFGTAELLAIIAMNPIWNIFILGVPKLLIYTETVEWTIN